jgi:citrate synthase
MLYCANFLHMMFSIPYQDFQVDPEIEDALSLLYILHGDHGAASGHAQRRMAG